MTKTVLHEFQGHTGIEQMGRDRVAKRMASEMSGEPRAVAVSDEEALDSRQTVHGSGAAVPSVLPDGGTSAEGSPGVEVRGTSQKRISAEVTSGCRGCAAELVAHSAT